MYAGWLAAHSNRYEWKDARHGERKASVWHSQLCAGEHCYRSAVLGSIADLIIHYIPHDCVRPQALLLEGAQML